MWLRAINLKSQNFPRIEDRPYDQINWDYIFEKDDRLNNWLREREIRNPIHPNWAFVKALDDDEAIPATQPLVSWPKNSSTSTPAEPTLSEKDKSKRVKASSSQPRSQAKKCRELLGTFSFVKGKTCLSTHNKAKGWEEEQTYYTIATHEKEKEEEEEKEKSSSTTTSTSDEGQK